jgi:hypothetical protein
MNQVLRNKIEKKKSIRKGFKTKQIIIKILRTKFDIKTNWYQILRDEIEKTNQLKKDLKQKKKESKDSGINLII